MDTLKYVVKRLLMAVLILFGVSVIIYSLSRMLPTSYVDNQYASAVSQGTMSQDDVDRIKAIYGLTMPDAYLSVQPKGSAQFSERTFTKNARSDTYERVENGVYDHLDFFNGSYDSDSFRLFLETSEVKDGDSVVGTQPNGYRISEIIEKGIQVEEDGSASDDDKDEEEDGKLIIIVTEEKVIEEGTYSVNGYEITFTPKTGEAYTVSMQYRAANFWDKAGSVLGSYFTWLGNFMKGDLGMSFKYKQPVGTVIAQNMGISFAIAFIATILQFVIAIPLGIKAATNQYGVVDYTVTVLTMIGISLPTFFLAALVIRVFALQLGWFPVNGLVDSLPEGTAGIVVFGNTLWHMILPMFVLVILSVGSLMRYTRTNTLEVLNADYIRTARAKGLSEKSVIYKHAFRNTMIPLVTLLAGTIPSLFGGAMITETVFAIPGIGKLAYDALVVADVPFIMGYNMFIALMTVLGTLLSDLLYAVVDPRVKLSK